MLIKIIQFLMSLSLIVIIHEFGHFFFAKLFKCKVEKFYLFFDWKFSLFKRKLGDTTYGIGWIPLGGYVKISGMVDESMDKEQLAQEPKPWEYRSKPAWQRLLIITGGVMMNFILAIMIYIGISWVYGESYISNKDVSNGYEFTQTAQEVGFRHGDKIISIDGKVIENSGSLATAILLGDKREVMVERNGTEMLVTIDDAAVGKLLKEGTSFMIPRHPFIIGGIATAQNSESLAVGDSLVSFNGLNMRYADEFKTAFAANSGDSVLLGLVRNTELLEERVLLDSDGKLGVTTIFVNTYPVTERHYSFFEAIPQGISMGIDQLAGYFDQLALIFSPSTEAYKGVGGFITMGKIFPDTWDWRYFWSITALLSIMIGALNIMPIPALDGGHLLFIIYEMITGREPSQKFMEAAQTVGFVLIIGLVLLANGNDIIKLFN
ncbi:MAG: RIP metalloprotease RseP [Rikenellaceae bacterium]